MLGFVPTEKALCDIVSHYAAELGITPFVDASESITVIKCEGDFEVIVAIEHEYKDASLTAPFDCVDMITEEKHHAGEKIDLGNTV